MAVRLAGLREVDAALKQLPDALQRRVVDGALAASARVVRDEAKARAPVATGKLRAGIVVRRAKGKARLRGATVVLGFLTPRSGGRSSVVHLLEFGTSKMAARPFVRPALAAAQARAILAFGRVAAAGVARTAKKLAGPISRRQRRRAFR